MDRSESRSLERELGSPTALMDQGAVLLVSEVRARPGRTLEALLIRRGGKQGRRTTRDAEEVGEGSLLLLVWVLTSNMNDRSCLHRSLSESCEMCFEELNEQFERVSPLAFPTILLQTPIA